MTLDQITQAMIALCGLSVVYLSQDPRKKWSRWACIAGLIGEPFWFLTAAKADQWGVMVLAVVYSIGWSRGVYYNWIKKEVSCPT